LENKTKHVLGRVNAPFEDGDVEDGTRKSHQHIGNANAHKRPLRNDFKLIQDQRNLSADQYLK
jgi:hypothetical protein